MLRISFGRQSFTFLNICGRRRLSDELMDAMGEPLSDDDLAHLYAFMPDDDPVAGLRLLLGDVSDEIVLDVDESDISVSLSNKSSHETSKLREWVTADEYMIAMDRDEEIELDQENLAVLQEAFPHLVEIENIS